MASASALLTTHAHSTSINVLSVARIAAGLGAMIAPAFFSQRVFGFSQRTLKGSSATISNTSVSAGSPEELTVAIRLSGARDIGLGLLLRDSASAVVERALQIGLIVDVLEVAAAGIGFFEGTLSREVATAVGTVGGISAAFQAWILNR